MSLEVQSQKGITVSSDILALGFFNEMAAPRGLAGEMDWLLNNTLSLLIKGGKITGRFGEVILVSSERTRTPKIFWVGLGKKEELTHAKMTMLAADLYRRLEKLEVKEAYLDLWDIDGCQLDFSSALNAFLNGIFQAKKESKTPSIDFTFHTRDPERIKELNRFLKEIDLRSPLSVSAKGD